MKLTFYIAIFMFVSLSFGQGNFWQISLNDGRILSHITINNLTADSLTVTSVGNSQRESISSIVEIRKVKHSKYSQGWKIGCLGGLALGGGIGAISYEEPRSTPGEWNLHFWSRDANAVVGSIIGCVAGCAIGGMIGSYAGHDEIYDFGDKTFAEKFNIIWTLQSKMKK